MRVKKSQILNVSKETPLEKGCFRLADKAKKSCNRCYGTGIQGENLSGDAIIVCSCVMKKIREEEKNEKRIREKGFNLRGLFKKVQE